MWAETRFGQPKEKPPAFKTYRMVITAQPAGDVQFVASAVVKFGVRGDS